MKKLVINDTGVFEQETYKLTPYGVTTRRNRIQNRILSLRGKVQDREIEIQNLKAEIEQEEKNLQLLNSPLIEAYLAVR